MKAFPFICLIIPFTYLWEWKKKTVLFTYTIQRTMQDCSHREALQVNVSQSCQRFLTHIHHAVGKTSIMRYIWERCPHINTLRFADVARYPIEPATEDPCFSCSPSRNTCSDGTADPKCGNWKYKDYYMNYKIINECLFRPIVLVFSGVLCVCFCTGHLSWCS